MKLKLGQKISIDDIEMTVTEIKQTFRGTIYHFIYFYNSQILECNFCMDELKALNFIPLVEGKAVRTKIHFDE